MRTHSCFLARAMDKRFQRVRDFYGAGGFSRIRGASVAVAGLGGVGSHCAIALARSGVARLHLIDFDIVTESSLNRNPLLHPRMTGRPKTECFAGVLSEQCPDTDIVLSNVFIRADSLSEGLIPRGVSAVADAIDSLNPKTDLLSHCVNNGLAVFSSMGAAGRRDITKVRTGGIENTAGCPLARMVRKYLRRRGVTGGITCVWSTEEPMEHLPPDDEPRLEGGRTRNTLPSLITLPGVFGYTMAQLILDHVSSPGSVPRPD